MKRWRGLIHLVQDAVDAGTSAVEKIHRDVARKPFDILEQIPPISEPTKGVRVVHDAIVSGVYSSIRLVNQAVGTSAGVILGFVEQQAQNATIVQSQAIDPTPPAASPSISIEHVDTNPPAIPTNSDPSS